MGLESISVLGRKVTRDILRYLLENERGTPSSIARALGVHVATVTRYLEALYELGVLERERKRGKTRRVYEYRIASRRVVIEVDLEEYAYGERRREERMHRFYHTLISEMIKRAEMAFGDVPASVRDVPPEPSVEDVRRVVEEFKVRYGPTITRSIFQTALSAANGVDLAEKYDLLKGWERWFT